MRSSASEEVLMSIESSSTASRLGEFEIHLRTHRYAAAIQRRYLWIAQRFVDYLGRQCIAVEAAHAPELEDFLRWELRSWRRRHGRDPRNTVEWRRRCVGIPRILRPCNHRSAETRLHFGVLLLRQIAQPPHKRSQSQPPPLARRVNWTERRD